MMLPIPIGYFVSVLLIISGVLNCMEYLAHRPDNISRAVLLNGLVETGWPIIAASVILLLIQMNRQLEKLRLEPSGSSALPVSALKKKKKVITEDKTAIQVQKHHQPVQPAVAPPMHPIVRPAAQTPAPTHPHTPVYPNSPIPGGGRVPQPAAAIPAAPATPPAPTAVPTASTPLPPRPEPIPPTRSAKRAPNPEEAGKLSFFKVD